MVGAVIQSDGGNAPCSRGSFAFPIANSICVHEQWPSFASHANPPHALERAALPGYAGHECHALNTADIF